MKLYGNKGSVVQSDGVMTTSAFSIARTPHMFNILSNSLYSDKIAAVLREIGCNAVDAHIMAGKPQLPIEVKLPTELDPSFYIKDWGPGLDHEEVTKLYTTYGWSNKQNSDEVTGAFGLGSKSPFAYTLQKGSGADGFTVEAAKAGVKRIYTCYLNEEGVPCVSKLYEGPSEEDWPNGVKVTFPVQQGDIQSFWDKAAEIFSWFAVKPRVLGLPPQHEQLVQNGLQFNYTGPDFALYPKHASCNAVRTFSTAASVVMAGVRYPIRVDKLYDNAPQHASLILCAGAHFWVNTGEVSITPSREELEYTPSTVEALRKRVEQAYKHLLGDFRETVKENAGGSTWQIGTALIFKAKKSFEITSGQVRSVDLANHIIKALHSEGIISSDVLNFISDGNIALTYGECDCYSMMPQVYGEKPYMQKVHGGLFLGKLTSKSGRSNKVRVWHNSQPHVVYLDDPKLKYVDARLRALVSSLGQVGDNVPNCVFYFGASHDDPFGEAMTFLKKNGLTGIKLLKASELPEAPQKTANRRLSKSERMAALLNSPVTVYRDKDRWALPLKDIPENERFFVVQDTIRHSTHCRDAIDAELLEVVSPPSCTRFTRGHEYYLDILFEYAKEYMPHLPQQVIILTTKDVRRLEGLLAKNYVNEVLRHYVSTYNARVASIGRYSTAAMSLNTLFADILPSSGFGLLVFCAHNFPDIWDDFVRKADNPELALDVVELLNSFAASSANDSRVTLEAKMRRLFNTRVERLTKADGDSPAVFRETQEIVSYFKKKYKALSLVEPVGWLEGRNLLRDPSLLEQHKLRLELLARAANLDAQEKFSSAKAVAAVTV